MIWRQFELLADDVLDAGRIGLLDDRAHLGSENAFRLALSSSAARPGMGFINCTPSFSAARPLSTFRKGTTALHVPQKVGGGLSLDVPVHRVLEQDRAENRSPVKQGLVMIRVRI